jgi:hypothetical protein
MTPYAFPKSVMLPAYTTFNHNVGR